MGSIMCFLILAQYCATCRPGLRSSGLSRAWNFCTVFAQCECWDGFHHVTIHRPTYIPEPIMRPICQTSVRVTAIIQNSVAQFECLGEPVRVHAVSKIPGPGQHWTDCHVIHMVTLEQLLCQVHHGHSNFQSWCPLAKSFLPKCSTQKLGLISSSTSGTE